MRASQRIRSRKASKVLAGSTLAHAIDLIGEETLVGARR